MMIEKWKHTNVKASPAGQLLPLGLGTLAKVISVPTNGRLGSGQRSQLHLPGYQVIAHDLVYLLSTHQHANAARFGVL